MLEEIQYEIDYLILLAMHSGVWTITYVNSRDYPNSIMTFAGEYFRDNGYEVSYDFDSNKNITSITASCHYDNGIFKW